MSKLERVLQKRNAVMQEEELKKEKQHKKNKLSAKERLELLFDKNTFVETNVFIQHRCNDFGVGEKHPDGDGVVTGYGKVNGRTVCAFAQDFTAFGGTLGEMHAKKIIDIQNKALELMVPIVGMYDSGGARIQEGVGALSGYGVTFFNNVKSSGIIPQISIIMGPCAGGASYSPALTDFIIMVQDSSSMFITGPNVVEVVTGQKVTAQELGGATMHDTISGVSHMSAPNDKEAIGYAKNLLDYLPQNYRELPYVKTEVAKTIDMKLDTIIPENSRTPYDMYDVINGIVDKGSIMEIQKMYAQNMITCFARVNGNPIGIVANQPKCLAGCIDVNASDKAARFVRTCDCYNIPIVNLVDVPGFFPGKDQEDKGIIRHGAKMLYAFSESKVTKITILVRKAYGGSYLAMCSKELGADYVFAWPTAEVAVMGAEGAVKILYKKQVDGNQELLNEKIREYEDNFSTPYHAAKLGYIDDIILPKDTRDCITRILSNTKKINVVPHGNIPL